MTVAGVVRRRGSGTGHRRGEVPGTLGLLALLLSGTALAAVLWELSGGPRAPDGAHLREVLSGAELADADIAAAASALAWLVLGYLALSVGLRLALLGCGRLSGGARWARTSLRLSTLVTIPAVRRVVDGGVGGTLLAASWLPLPVPVEVGGNPAYVAAAAAPAHVAWADAPAALAEEAPAAARAPCVLYTVVPGDDLWEIARRCYGDGSRWVEIASASGLPKGGHTGFMDPWMVRTGSVLRVPLPAPNVRSEDDALTYRVRRGDHLWGIAERFLGDGFRWVEIWERNRGREMGGGSLLTDPDRLEPGWLLELPVPGGDAALPAAEAAQRAASAVRPGLDRDGGGPVAGGAGAGEAGAAVSGGREWPAPPRPLLVTAAGFVLAGGTAVFVRRRGLNGLPRLRGRADDGAPGDAVGVTMAARSLARALADCGFDELRPLLVEESGRGLAFTLSCPSGDIDELARRRHDIERRLDREFGMEVQDANHVLVALPRVGPQGALPAEEAATAAPALVVPVGADEGGVVYLDLAAAGPVTLAGPEGERRRILRSWLATLATTHAPHELALRLDAETAGQLGDAASLPHAGGSGGAAPAELIPELEELLRSRASGRGHRPLLALVSPPPGGDQALESMLADGPRAGLSLVRVVDAAAPPGSHDPAGAQVIIGASADGPGDEEGGAGGGAIALTVGPGPPRHLDAVAVRRDTSARWAAAPDFGEAESDQWPRGDAGGGGALPDRSEPPPEEPPAGCDREPDPGERSAAVLASGLAGGSASAVDRAGAGEPDAAVAPDKLDPEEGAVASAVVAPQIDRDVAGDLRLPDTPREPADGPGEPGVVGQPADAPGSPAGDRDAPCADDDGRQGPPVPPGGPASPAGGGRTDGPLAGQAALFSEREMSDLVVLTEAREPVFHIRCLGPLEIRARGTPVGRWRLEKSRELLAFLAAHGSAPVAREVIAEALWQQYDWDASLRHSLSNAVTTLRSTLRAAAAPDELQPVVAALQRLQLAPSLFSVDLDTFDAAIGKAADLPAPEALKEYERALRLYAGEFLEGEYFTWLEPYRMDYRRRLLDAARSAGAMAEGMGNAARAAAFHRAILEREPTDEDAARGLMRCLARCGDVAGARTAFEELSQALVEELDDPGVRPSPETRALLAELVGAAARG